MPWHNDCWNSMDTGRARTRASFRSMIPDIRSEPSSELDDGDKTWYVSGSVSLNIVPISSVVIIVIKDGEKILPNSSLNKFAAIVSSVTAFLHCQIADDIDADDQASCLYTYEKQPDWGVDKVKLFTRYFLSHSCS